MKAKLFFLMNNYSCKNCGNKFGCGSEIHLVPEHLIILNVHQSDVKKHYYTYTHLNYCYDCLPNLKRFNVVDLLSSSFSNAIEEAYIINNSINKVTQAYIAFINIKHSLPINILEKDMFESFYLYLSAYISLNPNDKKSKKLWEICDNIISNNKPTSLTV